MIKQKSFGLVLGPIPGANLFAGAPSSLAPAPSGAALCSSPSARCPGDSGRALAAAAGSSPPELSKLTTLNVLINGFDADAAAALAEGLKGNTSLQSLS